MKLLGFVTLVSQNLILTHVNVLSTLNNTGIIAGGAGGTGGDGAYGSIASIFNAGTITGGAGEAGKGYGGHGIAGANDIITNAGIVRGGTGVYGSGVGGIGIFVTNSTLTNSRFIAGGVGGSGSSTSPAGGYGGYGVILSGTLFNTGTIAGGNSGNGQGAAANQAGSGVRLDSGMLYNMGSIYGGAGGTGTTGGNGGEGAIILGGTLADSGTITGGAYGFGNIADGTNGDAVLFSNSRSPNAELLVENGAVFNGKVVAGAAYHDILGLGGTSATGLSGIGTQFLNFSEITFNSGAAWSIGGNGAGLASGVTIAGFTHTDTIDLTGFAASSKTFASNALTLSNGTARETLDITGSFTTASFVIQSDHAGGTLIEVTCFARGTRIASARGQVPVEDLQIGDQVQTLHAGLQKIKWIGRRRFAAPFCNHPKILPIHIRAGAIGYGVPARDLFVSPGHAIAIDGALIHASRLVNGVTITQQPQAAQVEYFHIELATHEVIFAENLAAETYRGEAFRRQFQNAAEFHVLYPADKAPEAACLPMLDRGFQLAAILARLAARAGIRPAAAPGKLTGYIDTLTREQITGWAADGAHPNEPVILDILGGGTLLGRVVANIPRPDVAALTHHGFEFLIPAGAAWPVTVRRTSDHSQLGLAINQAA